MNIGRPINRQQEDKIDTLNSVNDFKFLVNIALKKGLEVDNKSIILNTKIYNTIYSYNLSNDGDFKLFNTEFENEYLIKNIKLLDCKPSLGMGLYSKKFKLYIGGAKFIKNNYFVIKALHEHNKKANLKYQDFISGRIENRDFKLLLDKSTNKFKLDVSGNYIETKQIDSLTFIPFDLIYKEGKTVPVLNKTALLLLKGNDFIAQEYIWVNNDKLLLFALEGNNGKTKILVFSFNNDYKLKDYFIFPSDKQSGFLNIGYDFFSNELIASDDGFGNKTTAINKYSFKKNTFILKTSSISNSSKDDAFYKKNEHNVNVMNLLFLDQISRSRKKE